MRSLRAKLRFTLHERNQQMVLVVKQARGENMVWESFVEWSFAHAPTEDTS